MMRLLALVALIPGAAWAEKWRVLAGDEIATALTDQSLIYDGATQVFYVSGRMLYEAGQDSWDCYGMAAKDQAVQFIGSDGSFPDGIYAATG